MGLTRFGQGLSIGVIVTSALAYIVVIPSAILGLDPFDGVKWGSTEYTVSFVCLPLFTIYTILAIRTLTNHRRSQLSIRSD